MRRFAKNIDDRKELVNWLKELTGEPAVYTRMPRCAYEVGAFTVEVDGTLSAGEEANEDIIEMLKDEGIIGDEILPEGPVEEEAPEPGNLQEAENEENLEAEGEDVPESRDDGGAEQEDRAGDDPNRESSAKDTSEWEDCAEGSEEPDDDNTEDEPGCNEDSAEGEHDCDGDSTEGEPSCDEDSAEDEPGCNGNSAEGEPGCDEDSAEGEPGCNEDSAEGEPDCDGDSTENDPECGETESEAERVENNPEEAEPDSEAAGPDAPGGDGNQDSGSITVSLPMGKHTGESLFRLVKLAYSIGPLLSKATGGNFGADRALLDRLDSGCPVEAGDFARRISSCGGLTGIGLEAGRVSFTGFPGTEDAGKVKAFQEIACAMNTQALTQKRIQAKEIVTESEKYTFRNWMVRIGLGGAEHKDTRNLLLENLSGHTAFRCKAEEEKWKANQKAKRDSAKAAMATQAEPAADGDGAVPDGGNMELGGGTDVTA